MKQREKERGFAWVVVFSSFLVHVITFGIVYSSGILFRLFLADFGQSHFETSWTGALMMCFTVLAGIPATVCIYRIGCGLTVLIGGGLATTGFALSRTSSAAWQTYTTIGLMGGAGFGFAITPAIMIVQCYFVENREKAMAIVASGIGLGQVTFPFLLDWLIREYDRDLVVTILAGITGLLCVCGLFMRPVSRHLYSIETLKIFNIKNFKSTAFTLLCVTNFLWSAGVSIMYTYLPDYFHASETNTTSVTTTTNQTSNATVEFDRTNIIAVHGFANFASRSIFFLLSTSSELDTPSIVMCSIGMSGMLTALTPEFFKTFGGKLGYAIIFGTHTGFWSVFMSHISRDVVGERRMAYGRGFIYLAISLGLCTGPPLAGWLYDVKESHEIVFYLAGGLLLASSIIMTAVNWKSDDLVAADSRMSLEMQPIIIPDPSAGLLAQLGNGASIPTPKDTQIEERTDGDPTSVNLRRDEEDEMETETTLMATSTL